MRPFLRRFFNYALIALTIGMVFLIAFGNQELENAWDVLFTLDPLWLLAAAGCWFAYLFFDGLGYHYFLRKQGHPVSVGFAVYISLTGFYYGNITPGASGGQPMQVYYMNRKGIPIGIGTSAISMKFICNQFIIVALATLLWALNADFVNAQLSGMRWLVILGWVINFSAVPLILLVASYRQLIQRLMGWLIRLGAKLRLVKQPDVAALRVQTVLDTYHASFRRLTRHPRQIIGQLLLSILSVMGVMSIVIAVYHAFGESGTPWYHLLTMSFLLFLSASYTPLPGASGAQEGGFLIFYRGLFTPGTLGLALLVWRFMSYYLFLIFGALSVVITHIRANRRKRDGGA